MDKNDISEGIVVPRSSRNLKFFATLILIYVIMMAIRVPYVASYADDFLFKLPFGYFRYPIYIIIIYLCVMELFNLETHSWIISRAVSSLLICIGLMLFISSIIDPYSASFSQNIGLFWKHFISTVHPKGGYVSPITGLLGTFFYSILIPIPGIYSAIIGISISLILILVGLSLFLTFKPFYLYVWIFKSIRYYFVRNKVEKEIIDLTEEEKYPFAERTREYEIEKKIGKSPSLLENVPDKYQPSKNPYNKYNNLNNKKTFFSDYKEDTSKRDKFNEDTLIGPFGRKKPTDFNEESKKIQLDDLEIKKQSKKISNKSFKKELFEQSFLDEYDNSLNIIGDKNPKDLNLNNTESHNYKSSKSISENHSRPYSKNIAINNVQNKASLGYSHINLPGIDNLKDVINKHSEDEVKNLLEEKKEKLINLFKDFNYDINVVNSIVGASVISFEIESLKGIRVSKITNMVDDIKLALGSKEVLIQSPIPGKSLIGIQVSNPFKEIISMKSVLIEKEINNNSIQSPLGKKVSGEPVILDIQKSPHLLIAGATGSGKSICINTIISSIIMNYQPYEVRMILVDPKRVELSIYNRIPHLMCPIINNPTEASNALKQVIKEMDMRFDLFHKYNCKNIESYNKLVSLSKKIPKIVVVIDELADLMMTAGKDIEDSITRISQLARAAGIHLIIATQRPSVDVITGLIKSNIPSRIAFSVSSGVDSRTILDKVGAETLLGYGDMLYQKYGSNELIRIQGCLIEDDEIRKLVEKIKTQSDVKYDPKFENLKNIKSLSDSSSRNNGQNDVMYEECKQFVIKNRKASSSLLQRKFSLGYNRAARIIDSLEEEGIIGPSKGSKPREVLI